MRFFLVVEPSSNILLHQRFLALLGEMKVAEADGDERARRRWLDANLRVTRGR